MNRVKFSPLSRRRFTQALTCGALASSALLAEAQTSDFKLRFLLASCMYGYESIEKILPELQKLGTDAIDLWPKVHGSQREEVQGLGDDRFASLLEEHGAKLGCITQYKLGPFALSQEFAFAKRFHCKSIVSSVKGGKGLTGQELKEAVSQFAKRMQPEFARAEQSGIRILLENHAGCMVESIDGILWLLDACEHPGFGFALAPAHLPQDSQQIASLVKSADQRLGMFYAWQFGEGFMKRMPREKELLQMPGRGKLDFRPILQALAEIQFSGWTEVMMHPTPRGIPIASSTTGVTGEIIHAQNYLLKCLNSSAAE